MNWCGRTDDECPTLRMLKSGEIAAYDGVFEFYWTERGMTEKEKSFGLNLKTITTRLYEASQLFDRFDEQFESVVPFSSIWLCELIVKDPHAMNCEAMMEDPGFWRLGFRGPPFKSGLCVVWCASPHPDKVEFGTAMLIEHAPALVQLAAVKYLDALREAIYAETARIAAIP